MLDSWITNITTTSTPNKERIRHSTPSTIRCLSESPSTSSNLSNTFTINQFVDKVSKDEKLKLDSMLAKAIYASGSPLSLLDNIYWKKLFETLRPAYVLPSSYQLSNKLLDSEVNNIKCFVEKLIVGSHCLGLMCDGWSNIRNESIINFVITTPKPVFYKSLPTLTERHTGDYMAKVMIEIIEEVGPGKVFGGIAIVNNIRRRHVLHAIFNEKQKESGINKKKSLMLPVQTRWGSVVVFLNSLLANKQIIRLLNIDERCEEDIIPRVKQFINNDIFWDRVKNLHNFLKPITYWITRIESDLPQLSIVPEIFVEIKKQYDTCIKNVSCFETEKNIIKNKIQSRKEFSVQQIHLAANVLHPKYRGNNLTGDENVDAATFIHRLSKMCLDIDEQKVMYDFAQYKVKEGIFSNTYVWEACANNLEPAVWWNAYCSSTELSKLASKILSLPATSAACERTFSTYNDVHSSKRNRLTNSRAGKLVYIKHNLKLKEETEKQINTPLAQQDYFENCESDCSAISVNLENEEEYNSDTDINSSEIDELMNMINS
ncbi:hypothetical protein QTP88_018586 [Uroleucon formosanum]